MRIKLLSFIFLLLGNGLALFSQNATYEWARSVGGTVDDYTKFSTIDHDGNLIVAGHFESSQITVGTIVLYNTTYIKDVRDVFVVKYDPLGNVLWAKVIGGSASESIRSVSADSLGNIVLSGGFSSQYLLFNKDTIAKNTADINNGWSVDGYILKINTAGNLVWVKTITGVNGDLPYGTCISKTGEIFVTGSSGSPVIGIDTILKASAWKSAGFVAKLNPSGAALWMQQFGGDQAIATSVSIDTSNFIRVLGETTTSILIGHDSIITKKHVLFLSKFDTYGNEIWAKSLRISAGAATSALDKYGNTILTGNMSSGVIDTFVITPHGAMDIFFAKYDANANLVWAKNMGGTRDELGMQIIADDSANIYIVAESRSPQIVFDTITITGSGNSDAIIAKYNKEGRILWVEQKKGGTNGIGGFTVCKDKLDYLYLGGYFSHNKINFGTTTLANFGGTVLGPGSDAFIAKMCEIRTPVITANLSKDICPGDTITLTSTPADSYLWSTGETTRSIRVSKTGNYAVTVNIKLCSSTSATAIVTVMDAVITANKSTTMCKGNVITLTATKADSYLWSTGDTTQSITVADSGSYAVTIMKNGCLLKSLPTKVIVNPLPKPIVTASGPTVFCQGNSVTLTSSPAESYVWSNTKTSPSILATQSANYYVIVTDKNGCKASSAAINVRVNPIPAVPTISVTGNKLTSSAITGNQWYLNNILISGAISIEHLATQNGNYMVMVTDSNGCSANSATYYFFTVDIETLTDNTCMQLFPNPTHDICIIQDALLGTELHIENAIGQVVLKTTITSSSTPIDISAQPKGIYFFKFFSAQQCIIKKVIHE